MSSNGLPLTHPISLDAIARKIESVQALPPLVTELVSSFEHPEVDIGTLACRISADQSFAARVLRVANSPFYGLSGRVETINDAIVVLGVRTVRSLALSTAIVATLSKLAPDSFDTGELWRHSVGVALCARALAGHTGENPNTAFVTGLLHDMGRLFLAAYFPEHYKPVVGACADHGTTLIDTELTITGIGHDRVGEMLARQWGFPAAMADAIGRHHAPDRGTPAKLADIVHAADVLERALELDGSALATVPPLAPEAWRRLAIDWEKMPALVESIENNFAVICHAIVPAE